MPLKLYRKPGRENYYLRGTVRGVEIYESAGTTCKETAETIRSKREWEILQGTVFGFKTAGRTFLDATISYLENGGDGRFVQVLSDHFGATQLDRIDQAAIEAAGRKLYPNAAPASVIRRVHAPISVIINNAAKRGMCAPIKLQRPKLPKGRVRWLHHKEAASLIEACAPHLKPLVAFLFYTGARIGEALWLDWRFVDLERGQVQFVDTKNGTDRGVPLHEAIVPILASLPHREGCVFRRADGFAYTRLDDDNAEDTSAGTRIKSGFQGACRRANIRDFSPHDCRHTWATWHYQANKDINLLMQLGGWKSERMVLRYAHTNVAHAAPSIAAMPTIALVG